MESKKAEKIAKALSDPNRLKIIRHIKRRNNTFYCCDLDDIIDLSQPSICHHMKQLTDCGLVTSEKEGRNVKYALNTSVLNAYIDFLEALKTH